MKNVKLDDLIVHNKNFQQYDKIIIVDEDEKPIYEYSLTKTFRSKCK